VSGSPEVLERTLRTTGAVLGIGPFLVRLHSSLASVAGGVALHYDEQLLAPDTAFCDFHIAIRRGAGVRALWRPQARFFIDGNSPFKPLPLSQAFPLFEWGLNWCIAQHAHHYLMIHAAVVERGGRALLLAGAPGTGKSTLCAALVMSGWRLLSDEFALIGLDDGRLGALPRPISLKNAAIDLIRRRFPDAVIGPPARDTAKGTVAHLRCPPPSVRRATEPAVPAHIVFPLYAGGAPNLLTPLAKARALLKLVNGSFNYNVLGSRGFETAADLIDACTCHNLDFSDLDPALQLLDDLPNTVP